LRRTDVVNSIIDALKDLNVSVYEWRVTPAEFNELPIIVVRDKDDNIEEEASGSTKHNLKIEIEYTNAKKELTVQDVRENINLLLNSLKTKDEKELIGDYTSIKNIEVDLEHNEIIVGRGIIDLEIIYYTEKWEI
jgi:tRNA U34 5-carboxymethylaminomethyl modifying GTPase MnmE/TrmE